MLGFAMLRQRLLVDERGGGVNDKEPEGRSQCRHEARTDHGSWGLGLVGLSGTKQATSQSSQTVSSKALTTVQGLTLHEYTIHNRDRKQQWIPHSERARLLDKCIYSNHVFLCA